MALPSALGSSAHWLRKQNNHQSKIGGRDVRTAPGDDGTKESDSLFSSKP